MPLTLCWSSRTPLYCCVTGTRYRMVYANGPMDIILPVKFRWLPLLQLHCRRWAGEVSPWLEKVLQAGRETQTPAQSPTRGAVVLAARLGWDKFPKFWSSATLCFLLPLSRQRGGGETEQGKKVKWWGGGEEREGGRKARRTAVFGLERSRNTSLLLLLHLHCQDCRSAGSAHLLRVFHSFWQHCEPLWHHKGN